MNLHQVPRAHLGTLPTPLVPAPRLSEEVGVEIWFKRDDLTGHGLGGNKVRSLEFLIGAAQAQDSDCFVTGGGPQSNWVMLAALAAVTRDMQVHIVYFGPPVDREGNLLLVAGLPGVEIGFTGDPDPSSVDSVIDATADGLRSQGKAPYVAGRGGAGPVGALGYLSATAEIDAQLDALGIDASVVWLATGSCGTQAGLVAGHALSPHPRKIIGVSVHRPMEECRMRIHAISQQALDLIGAKDRNQVEWEVLAGQLEKDETTAAAARRAAALTARTEGVFLDPEFGAPAMAELINRADQTAGPVLFMVTGGSPTLFTRQAWR